ncbi:tyrosine-type recombinase/integrase [Candidatus Galacturonibacter soehngenii]|uniref:Tyrosine-type recombinase/integrase n=1 Tax=Candidatus Galacturonatibacter soehngenii TaxID=2307010 RepID=A0A7V7QJY2_9FIRM|nr:site-specific integrase [Candidatus Galacturonibacter soehngenii]KAB1437886.1 tyrosine-type recombinase/integrase [Candidatus Galacturonibacter soehngenii]
MAVDKNGKKLPKGVTQRADGLYMGRFEYHGEKFAVYDKSLKEVQKKLNDLRYEVEHGVYAKKQNLSLNAWFETWMLDYKKNVIKIGTYTIYENHYNYYIRRKLGNKKITDVRPEHIQRLYNELVSKDFATGSIKLISAMLNGCFKQAEKNGIITKNPVPLAAIPKGKAKKERKVFTVEEQELFLKYSKESYLHDFFILALMTGMRNGELRALQWRDIDFQKKIIYVNHTLVYIPDKGHFLDEPKTKTSKRQIPMIDKSYDLLKKRYDKATESNVIHINDERFVFCLHKGEPITRDRVTLEINKVLKSIEDDGISFDYVTCHCFRHTFATRCIENKMEPQVLKTILGHSSLSMTMDLYSHVLPNTKQEEMQKISNLF